MLDQSPLMLKGITLAQMIQLVVQVFIDLSSCTVLDEETAQNAKTAHPQDLAGHARVLGTLPFSETRVATGALGVSEDAGAAARVHRHGLLDDQTISDELTDSLAFGEGER